MASKKARAENGALAAALEAEDVVAVALALRSAGAIVPLLPDDAGGADFGGADFGDADAGDAAQVRVFRRGDADKYMLLLFSSSATYEAMLPEETSPPIAVYGADELLDFLRQNEGVLEAVWFDVAGPHAMQADPADVIAALTLPRG
ncbi:MAG: dehydrogenase [Glaciihabitans sp.]|nr:dehydrogenase [Glaciihabitans sp.]